MFLHRSKSLIILVVFLLTFVVGTTVKTSKGAATDEKIVSTVSGLDFDKVAFLIITRPEFRERLNKRADDQLTKAGLLKPNRTGPNPERPAALILTLNPISLDEISPGKIMYVQKIELWEEISPLRNPEVHFQGITWSYGNSNPTITDKVTVGQLEDDLDRFMSEFIRSYKMGRSVPRK